MISSVKKAHLDTQHKVLLLKEEMISVIGQSINEVVDKFFESCPEVKGISWTQRIRFNNVEKDETEIESLTFYKEEPNINQIYISLIANLDTLPQESKSCCRDFEDYLKYVKEYLPRTIGENVKVLATGKGISVKPIMDWQANYFENYTI